MLIGRRGLTLIELMLATVTMLIVGAAVQRMLQSTLRLSRAQADQIQLQTSVRGAILAVANELGELSTREGGTGVENDLLSIAPGEVTYRAMRGIGFLCEMSLPGQLKIGRQSFTGHRIPQPGRDSVLVVHEAAAGAAPAWVPVAIEGVSTANPCPGSGNPGLTLVVPVSDSITGASAGTPVRIYENMQLRLYESGGKSWLGMRSVSAGEVIQPLFGPLRGDSGFRLDYLDLAGRRTADADAVKSIWVAIRGETESKLTVDASDHAGGQLELSTQVVLRNALH